MKIAFILDDTLDSTDGVQQYVISLGNWLSENGHQVCYIVGQTIRNDISNVYSVSKNITVSFNKNKLTIPLPVRRSKIVTILEREKPDLIHVQMPYSPFMAAKVIRYAHQQGTAIVGTFHILPFSKKEQIATTVLGKLLRNTNRKFDNFISVSEPAKQFAAQSFGISSTVIPNPVNVSLKDQTPTFKVERVRRIVFLGRLVPRKGPLELIKVFKRVIENHKDIHLDIYGEGQLKPKIESYIKHQSLVKHVTLHGFVDESKKMYALKNADIAVFPSLGGESFGIVLIEAIAAGAGVVIGGDNPGYRSVLKYDETLFNPLSANDMQKCIEKFINTPTLVSELHIMQSKLLKSFTIKTVGEQILSVYKDAVASKQ